MNADELKEMFDPNAEAAGMELDVVITQVHEMRGSEPDNIDMSDGEIAAALQS